MNQEAQDRLTLLNRIACQAQELFPSQGRFDSEENRRIAGDKVREIFHQQGVLHCKCCGLAMTSLEYVRPVLLPVSEKDGVVVIVHVDHVEDFLQRMASLHNIPTRAE